MNDKNEKMRNDIKEKLPQKQSELALELLSYVEKGEDFSHEIKRKAEHIFYKTKNSDGDN